MENGHRHGVQYKTVIHTHAYYTYLWNWNIQQCMYIVCIWLRSIPFTLCENKSDDTYYGCSHLSVKFPIFFRISAECMLNFQAALFTD